MHAVVVSSPGGPDALRWTEVDDPVAGPGEVVLDVVASAVNRADVLQRRGLYPPPEGAAPYPGLECSGRVSAVGPEVSGWSVGDEACALLSGGGYAERVAVPAGQLLPVPRGVDLATAAALPEVACTVWSNVSDVARLAGGETLLVHGGASGVGTFAIQYAVALGAVVVCTAGSPAGRAACLSLGASLAVDYREDDFVAQVRAFGDGHGADVVLDNMGAAYLARNVDVLAVGGRLVVIGLQGGMRAELDLGLLLVKRGTVTATSLRARPAADKARIVAAVREEVWPLVERGAVRPVVHETFPLPEAARAHERLEAGGHVGKLLLLR